MKPNLRGFLIALGALVSLSLWPSLVSAQSSDDTSVADAARKAREQKKNAPKAARTLTNDDLPAAAAADSKPAAAPSEAVGPGKPAEGAAAPAEKKAVDAEGAKQERSEKKAGAEAALKQAKADLAQSQGELNVLERKQALDSDSYYSKTDYRQDTAGKAVLDADGQAIGDKKSQVEALKNKIAELQAEIEKYSGPEPSAPQQPN
jgi:hypothetical protein